MKTLKQEVKKWLKEKEEYTKQEAIDELLQHGCQSGIVNNLIYYKDTTDFFEKHRKEILNLLQEVSQETGQTAKELFGDKWANIDQPFEDTQNQNLLAWFAFEETARMLQD